MLTTGTICPSLRNSRGVTLVELVMAMVLIAVLVSVSVPMVQDQLEYARFETTRQKMEVIRDSIIGVDWNKTDGPRAGFGYVGDMGRIPSALIELTTQGTQPTWAFSTASGVSAGWRGPYLTSGATGSQTWNSDEWGQPFLYFTTNWPARLVSYGADRTTGGTGYSKDLTIHLETYHTQATVRGVLLDNNRRVDGGVVEIAFVTDGTLTTSTTTTGASGNFTFSAIPMGVRAMRVTSPSSIPYRLVRVDKPDMPATAALNFLGATEALSWNAGSERLFGGANAGTQTFWVMGTFKSTFSRDLTVKAVTFGCTNGAHVRSYKLNGVETILNTSPECGTYTTVGNNQVVPAGSDVNVLEIRFDSNMKDVPISVAFDFSEQSGSSNLQFTPTAAWANAAGTWDTAFGTDGYIRFNSGGGNLDLPYAVTLETNGRILVAGRCNSDLCFARFKTDGLLDTSFATTGFVVRTFSTGDDEARSITVTSDGKLMITGTGQRGAGGTYQAILARYGTNGAFDTTFATTGFAYYTFSTGNTSLFGAAISTLGDIVVGGDLYSAANDQEAFVVRLRSNGAIDTSFFSIGVRSITRTVASGFANFYSLALDTFGRALVLGQNQSAAAILDIELVRLNTNGSFDTSFSTSGQRFWSLGGNNSIGFHQELTSDGKIVSFYTNDGTSSDVGRMMSNGAWDTSFAGTGKRSTSNVSRGNVCSRVLMPNGKVVDIGDSPTPLLMRLNSNGSYDTSFATIGYGGFSLNNLEHSGECVTMQSDGKYVVVFQASTGGATGWDIGIVKIWP